MKPCVFTGSAVAIVTPFCGDGVDLEAFDRLIKRQIKAAPTPSSSAAQPARPRR